MLDDRSLLKLGGHLCQATPVLGSPQGGPRDVRGPPQPSPVSHFSSKGPKIEDVNNCFAPPLLHQTIPRNKKSPMPETQGKRWPRACRPPLSNVINARCPLKDFVSQGVHTHDACGTFFQFQFRRNGLRAYMFIGFKITGERGCCVASCNRASHQKDNDTTCSCAFHSHSKHALHLDLHLNSHLDFH